MERFRRILICTTNRLINLDQASIRRFNFKIGFNYLKPEGNVLFYTRLLAPLTSEPLTDGAKLRPAQISPLGTGDFRILRDRIDLCPPETVTHDGILKALEEKAKIKKFHSRVKQIGI
jgi:transitional endoplasmic reticulum ATPase